MFKNKKLVALLPIKRNSQRVPNKNFRSFQGKPLFHWILDTLLNIKEIDEIIINTDASTQIAKSGLPGEKSGRVRLRERKPHLLGDETSMNLILADDLTDSQGDIYIMTHATNPLLKRETISQALGVYIEHAPGQIDSLFAVNRIQARVYRQNGAPVNHDPAILVQTQDLEPCYVENSNLYIFSRASFMVTNSRIGQKPYMFEMNPLEAADIDTETDWRLAALLATTSGV